MKIGEKMRLNAPKKIVWTIALIVGLVGIIAQLITIPFLSSISFWIMGIAWLLLILSTVLKGL